MTLTRRAGGQGFVGPNGCWELPVSPRSSGAKRSACVCKCTTGGPDQEPNRGDWTGRSIQLPRRSGDPRVRRSCLRFLPIVLAAALVAWVVWG